MHPERWRKIKTLFDQAADLAPDQRSDFLAQACADDAGLRSEVEALLLADQQSDAWFDDDLPRLREAALQNLKPKEIAGERIGAYRILDRIGQGGMASVYSAVRADEHYQQKVAIKLIRRGMDSESMRARFLQERQILATLDHPNIAQLYDGGVTEDGLPYLVMEWIDGEPIDRYVQRQALDLEARLRLFRTVCGAVQYAHRNLVIHRDLKPSNILVTPLGVPKLLDFGIAKWLEHEEILSQTRTGLRPMTPDYASPEQVLGQPITTASDTYSLGVLLYRLLTGQGPYRLPPSRTLRDVERAICEQEPAKPSAVEIPDSAGFRQAERYRRRMRGDIDNIVRMSLRKAPEARYGSVDQLSEDVRRHLEGLPVQARPSSFIYRFTKFIRRHRVGTAASVAILLILVAGMVATSWQARVAEQQRLAAERTSEFLIDLFEVSYPGEGPGGDITALELLDLGSRRITRGLDDQPEIKVRLMDTMGLAYFKLGAYDRAEPLFSEAYVLRQEALGRRALDVTISQNHLGELMTARARYSEAESLHKTALAARRQTLGDEHVLVAESESNLATVLFHQNRFDEAEAMLRQALARHRRLVEAPHRAIASNLSNLALIRRTLGHLDESAELYREALSMNQQLWDDQHPEVAINLNNLAEVLRLQGQPEEARANYQQALELETALLGEHHPTLVTTLSNLAGCALDLGETEKAESLATESLELARQILGEESAEVVRGLSLLGRMAFDRNDFETAERQYSQALSLSRRLYGMAHRDQVALLNNLAATAISQGQLDKAETLYREGLETNRQLFGEAHEATVRSWLNLAALLARQEAPDPALEHYSEALERLEQLPEDHRGLQARAHRELADLMARIGRSGDAETHYRHALTFYRAVFGDEHLNVAMTRTELGRTLIDLERLDESVDELRLAIGLWQQGGDRGQRGLAIAQGLLGSALTALERYAEAEAELLPSRTRSIQLFGDSHPRTLDVERWLEQLYAVWKRAESAGS